MTDTRRITLSAPDNRVRLYHADTRIADTPTALRLDEHGYPSRWYLPIAALDGAHLVASATRTHCPFKGEATYYDLQIGDVRLADAAWSYRQPIDAMAAIAGRVAFDHPTLETVVGPSAV